MTICAVTMVYRDHWALSRWYAHHARALGAENLYVIAHGADPRIAEICPGASIITVPRRDLAHFDRARAEMIDGFHTGLSRVYDWVIRTDADELICHDPDLYPSLPDAIEAQEAPVLWALGFDVVERPDAVPLADGPVFATRRDIAFSGHYSKAFAARRPIGFRLHGVAVAPKRLDSFPFLMPRGLYLAHLKYANRAVLDAGNEIRQNVARGDAPGLPGGGWKEASEDATRFYDTFEAKKPVSWADSESHAHETLSVKPSRLDRYNVVKTRALKFRHRTTLPDRFCTQG